MSKNYFDAKFQEELMEVEEYSMAQLMCRRGHEFLNKKGSEFYMKGFSLCVSSSNGGARLFLLSDKLPIGEYELKVMTTLMATYRAILLPFFPEIEKEEKKKEARAKRQDRKARRKYNTQEIIWRGAGQYVFNPNRKGLNAGCWVKAYSDDSREVPYGRQDLTFVTLSIRDISKF